MVKRSVKVEICSRLFLYLLEKKNKNAADKLSLFKTSISNVYVLIKFASIAYSYNISCISIYMFMGYLIGNSHLLASIKLYPKNLVYYTSILMQYMSSGLYISARIVSSVSSSISSSVYKSIKYRLYTKKEKPNIQVWSTN